MKHALIYTKKLEGAGLTREQAQAHLEILEEIVDGDMAAKADVQNAKNEVLMALGEFKSEVNEFKSEVRRALQGLRNEMDSRFQELCSEMDTRFQEVWAEIRSMRSDMKMMEQRIVLKMGVMIVAAVGFMSALFTLVR